METELNCGNRRRRNESARRGWLSGSTQNQCQRHVKAVFEQKPYDLGAMGWGNRLENTRFQQSPLDAKGQKQSKANEHQRISEMRSDITEAAQSVHASVL